MFFSITLKSVIRHILHQPCIGTYLHERLKRLVSHRGMCRLICGYRCRRKTSYCPATWEGPKSEQLIYDILDSKGVSYNNHAFIKPCIVKFESFLHLCIWFKQAFMFISFLLTGFGYLWKIISWYYCPRQKSNTDSLVSFPSDSYIQ